MKAFINELIPLNKADQGVWQQWQRSLMHLSTEQSGFWYLSSGADFFPVSYFSSLNNDKFRASVFIYTDHSERRYTELMKHGATVQSEPSPFRNRNLKQEFAMPMKFAALDSSVLFMVFRSQNCNLQLIPLFYIYASNEKALQFFKRKKMNFKYLCTVADGCRSLDVEKKDRRCPMQRVDDFRAVIPHGYWLSDHVPEGQEQRFRKTDIIHGWGRYNLEDITWMYKIDN